MACAPGADRHRQYLGAMQAGCKAHGGPEARETALEARHQTAVRRMLNADDGLRSRVVARDALSVAILAERDLAAVDCAGGEGD